MQSPANLQSPSLNLAYDLSNAPFFIRNNNNFILQLTGSQLPVMQNLSMFDIRLSQSHTIEPHWHPNAAELVYVISGEAIVTVLDTFTRQLLTYRVKPPQAVYIPMAWWHWEIALTDNTQLLAIFDNAAPQTVFGSDVLRKTPPEVLQLSYGINGAQLAQVLQPITQTVVIGPPNPSFGQTPPAGAPRDTESIPLRTGTYHPSTQ
ncbi:cupin [Paenibacillus baekrokdamisoli]|uniref:Cupin n=2 Tax=Paenibacillus baekrokdamisoli TaxID=1712516 RepID=A0A3G9INV7_9BACL|nr:cupin [Paenibacillus baekrokdamisoli]